MDAMAGEAKVREDDFAHRFVRYRAQTPRREEQENEGTHVRHHTGFVAEGLILSLSDFVHKIRTGSGKMSGVHNTCRGLHPAYQNNAHVYSQCRRL
jgi:hypothetical protein